jgi:sec-independent protein translocase protein TatA
MGGLAWWHWLIIIAAFILLFGARKLPEAARGVGRSLRILKSEVNAMHEDEGKDKKPSETDSTAAQSSPTPQIAAIPIPQQTTPVQPVQTPQSVPAPVQPVTHAQPVAHPVPVPQTEYYSDPTRAAGS